MPGWHMACHLECMSQMAQTVIQMIRLFQIPCIPADQPDISTSSVVTFIHSGCVLSGG